MNDKNNDIVRGYLAVTAKVKVRMKVCCMIIDNYRCCRPVEAKLAVHGLNPGLTVTRSNESQPRSEHGGC